MSTPPAALGARPTATLHLLRLAGGQPDVLDSLRHVLWRTYTDEGFPYGPTEDGMLEWACAWLDLQPSEAEA